MTTARQFEAVDRRASLPLERILGIFAAAIIMLGAIFWLDRPVTAEQKDFSVTYLGSRMVYLGLGSKLYDLEEQHKLKAVILPHGEPLIYEHPPFEALLLAPLGAIPYRTAYLLWGFVNIAIWLTLPWLLRPYAPVPREDLGYIALWIVFAPLGVTLFQGQSSLVMLLLYALAFIAFRRGQDFRMGIFLGLALLKFQFAIPFAVIFLLRKKWTFIKGFLATASMLGLLSWVAVGARGIWSYLHLLAAVAIHPNNQSYGSAVDMATLQGLVHALLGGILSQFTVFLIVAGTSAFLLAWTARKWNCVERNGDAQSNELMFAVAVAISLVTGLHMFIHDLSPMMLAMMLVAARIGASPRLGLKVVLLTCMTLFWIPPVYFVLLARHRMYVMVPLLLTFIFATAKMATKDLRIT